MKSAKSSNRNPSQRIRALIARLAFCAVLLSAANSAFAQLNQGTARWWTGTSGDYKMGTANNWTNSAGATGAPASGSGDIAIWDLGGLTGNIAGNVLQVTNAAGNSSNPGETLQVTGNHTNGLTIVATGGSALRLGTNSLVIASGSGPVSLGNGGANQFPVALVLGSGGFNYFTNNSAYTATINSDVNFTMGGGNLHYITLCGSGSWNLFNNWAPVNNSGGSQDQMIINCAGTVTYAPTNETGITYAAPFSGITLNTGTFKLGNAWCLTNLAGSLTLNGGTYDINGFNITNNLSGAANIDTSAVGGTPTLTVSNSSSSTFSGIIKNTAGTLSLSKLGAGALTLSGIDTYSGSTTINAGTLLVNGTIGSGTVTVASGASLGGTGTVGGSVNWQSGSSALFTVTNSGGVNPLYLKVSGSLTLNNNAVTINVPGSTPLPIGTYTLVNAGGGSTGQFVTALTSANYTGAGVASGTLSTIATSGGVATLSVAAAGVATTWTNDLLGGTGDWAMGANWASNPYAPTNAGDTAVLGVGSAVSTVTISQNMSLGAITFTNPSSFIVADAGKTLTFDNFGGGAVITVNSGTSNAISTAVSLKDKSTFNVAGGTVLSLSNVISSTSGANTLTKNGTGTLVLSANNTYGPAAGTVGTIASGGTLELANSHALGSGDLTNSGSVTLKFDAPMTLANKIAVNASSGTLILNDQNNAITLAGGIVGGGALNKSGTGLDVITNGTSSISTLSVNGSSGTLEIASNTVVQASGQLFVENNNILQIDAGATLNYTASGYGYVGNTTGTTATNIIYGTLNYSNANFVVARNGGGNMTINSGHFLCNNFFVGQASASDIGYLYLNGGSLVVNNVQSGGGINYFYFNGGALVAKAASTTFWADNIALIAYVQSNPGTIDNGGNAITIAQPINSETGTDGGLIFQGTSVTTLSAANGYNGPTAVNAGTLLLTGSIGSGNVTVASNATLQITGSTGSGSVTVANGASLGGTGSVGGPILWQPGSAANFYVTNNGSGNATPLSVGGNVTLNSNNVTINVAGSTPLTPGAYILMYSGGISSGHFAATPSYTGAGVTGGTVSTVFDDGYTVTLSVSVGGNTWTHDGNGNWSTLADWSGNPNIPRLPGDSALLGVGSALTTITLDTNVSMGGISFTNPNSFIIANAGRTLTLTNLYGTAAVNVTAGQANAIAAPVVLNTPSIVAESTGGTLGISGGITGTGNLTIGGDGTGVLTLTGTNTYSGLTTLSAGTLALGSTNAISTNTLVIYGGNLDSIVTNLVDANNNPQVWIGSFGFAGSNNLNLGTGGVTVSNSLTLSVTNALVVGGNINGGALTLTLNGTGTLELDGNNAFGTVSTSIPLLLFGNDYAAGNNTAILNCALPGAAFASSSSATRTIHNILGANGGNGWTFSGTGNLIFDGGVTSYNFPKGVTVNNPVTTWNFALPNGLGSTTKYGIGTLVLAGTNANTGGNQVNAGTLALANSSALGTGPLTMNGGNLDSLTANLTNINSNPQTWNSDFTFLGSQSLDLGNGAVTMANSVAITVTNTLTVEGAIGDGGSGYSLTKKGSGTLVLAGANTYTGNTTIQAGTLELAQNAPTLASGSTVALASGAHLQLDDGTVTNVVTMLVVNGSTNAPGVYNSANSSGYLTGLGFLQVLTGPAGPTGSAHLTNSVSGSTLSLSWPAGQGWRLVSETNSLSTGLNPNPGAWGPVPGVSDGSATITIDPSKPTVFYRLVYP